MNTILDIINKYRTQLNNGNFNGDIYFPDNNGKLQIDRAVFNKMLDMFIARQAKIIGKKMNTLRNQLFAMM